MTVHETLLALALFVGISSAAPVGCCCIIPIPTGATAEAAAD